MGQQTAFLRCLISSQARLYAYVVSLLRDPNRAHDVLQNANVVMLDKSEEFIAQEQEFLPWAYKVCYFEVLGDRRDLARDRHLFDEAALEKVATAAAESSDGFEDRLRALATCLDSLPDAQRQMIQARYAPDGSVKRIASETGRSTGSISQTLYRVREALLNCIQARLSAEGAND